MCAPTPIANGPQVPSAGEPGALATGQGDAALADDGVVAERKVRQVLVEARRLRGLGFRIAIDDLGEGYAGLTSLARVAPEFVKLDMSLVRGIDASIAQRQIVASTVQLCRALGSEIIAEGVETVAERDALAALGLDYLQGYLIARPAPDLVVPSLS